MVGWPNHQQLPADATAFMPSLQVAVVALGPPGHFRNLILHNNHSLASPPVGYSHFTYLAICDCSTMADDNWDGCLRFYCGYEIVVSSYNFPLKPALLPINLCMT